MTTKLKNGKKRKMYKDGKLVGGQVKLDKNKDGKISGEDFKMMKKTELKLPTEVRNKMGFMKKGGKVKAMKKGGKVKK